MAFSHSATASVIISVSDDGTDMTVTFSGSINRTIAASNGTSVSANRDRLSGNQAYTSKPNYYYSSEGVNSFISGITLQSNSPSKASGSDFGGYITTSLVWDAGLGVDPVIVNMDYTTVYTNRTVASVFGTTLDGGLVTTWTHNLSGDTFQIQSVPEPSALVLSSISGLLMLARRRRRS